MQTRDLIKELSSLPQDTEVLMLTHEGDSAPIVDVPLYQHVNSRRAVVLPVKFDLTELREELDQANVQLLKADTLLFEFKRLMENTDLDDSQLVSSLQKFEEEVIRYIDSQ